MGKALPIVGIVAAVFGMLTALVLVNAAVFVVLPVVLAGSLVLLAQRNVQGSIAGLLVLVLGVIATLGLAGSVTTKNGSADFGISNSAGLVWAILACLAVPLGALAVRWESIEPKWMAYVGIAGAVLGLLLATLNRAELSDQTNPVILFAGVLVLAPILPMVALLRSGTAAPPASNV